MANRLNVNIAFRIELIEPSIGSQIWFLRSYKIYCDDVIWIILQYCNLKETTQSFQFIILNIWWLNRVLFSQIFVTQIYVFLWWFCCSCEKQNHKKRLNPTERAKSKKLAWHFIHILDIYMEFGKYSLLLFQVYSWDMFPKST